MKTDDELIAEFDPKMKWTIPNNPAREPYWRRDDCMEVKVKNFKYQTSWDWLMPVVEKIQFYAHVKIENTQCLITVNGNLITGVVGGDNIDNVYKAAIEFINWYNTQPTNDIN